MEKRDTPVGRRHARGPARLPFHHRGGDWRRAVRLCPAGAPGPDRGRAPTRVVRPDEGDALVTGRPKRRRLPPLPHPPRRHTHEPCLSPPPVPTASACACRTASVLATCALAAVRFERHGGASRTATTSCSRPPLPPPPPCRLLFSLSRFGVPVAASPFPGRLTPFVPCISARRASPSHLGGVGRGRHDFLACACGCFGVRGCPPGPRAVAASSPAPFAGDPNVCASRPCCW